MRLMHYYFAVKASLCWGHEEQASDTCLKNFLSNGIRIRSAIIVEISMPTPWCGMRKSWCDCFANP